ncbi:LuxR family transcriptional regulator [Epibacterium ulvae]|uniref:LuxR family transcriptional regulator n=1 Tax=Epibacterium ulvae TaxID=1156985 RepID=UPI001BFCCDEA|nr:LuxR family transcriptional regulator [Epibacterium ulvae]MBT8154434.1 LuxR family transcriptional regulator [Epibacterium ulvae]
MDLVEFLAFVAGCRNLEHLWKAYQEKMAEYGFDRVLYGYTRHKVANSLGDPDDFLILSNHGQAYMEGFIRSGLYFHAPMVRWALENEGACSWSHIQALSDTGALDERALQVIEFNRKMAMTAGYTISFFSFSPRFKGAVSLAAADMTQDQVDALWLAHGSDIELINNIVHLKILTLPYVQPNRSLTNRQREALQWVGDGKTTQDIATIMDLTTATIEKHLRLAREALAVDTSAQAVLKAAMSNQIYQMES